jgi:Flp pilus assembly protein TadG
MNENTRPHSTNQRRRVAVVEMVMLPRTKVSRIRPHDRRGAAVVECAIVLPLLILVTMSAIDAGQFINVSQVVNDASREGCRRASRATTANQSDVEAAVQSYFADAFPGQATDDLNAALTVSILDSVGSAVASGDLTTITEKDAFTVQVIFEFDAVRWIGGLPLFSSRSIGTTTEMRRN